MRVRPLVTPVLLALVAACSGEPGPDTPPAQVDALRLPAELPEHPALRRDTAIAIGGVSQSPGIPAHRTSNDGRVALDLKQDPPSFYLMAPERLTTHLWDGPNGASILASTAPVQLQTKIHRMPNGGVVHTTLCDGTVQFDTAGKASQPYACGDQDCYDLTLIASVGRTDVTPHQMQLWGTPVRVAVSNPKTAAARIASVQATGAPVGGKVFSGIEVFFEPMVTRDGHLLVGRVANGMTDFETGESIDIAYSTHDAGASPCDVTRWTRIRAITRAPSDPSVNTRYGFARYPFRDAEGAAIKPGADLHGTYPWIDRDGRNLFFTVVDSTLYFKDSAGQYHSRYRDRCASGTTCDPSDAAGFSSERRGNARGPTVMGLWTHGRAVVLDGRIRHTDYGLLLRDDKQRELRLYADNTGPAGNESGWVRVGGGRDNTGVGFPAGFPANTTFIESTENLFQHLPSMKPRTPRDVVWLVNSELTTEEIAFDDWLDPHAVVVSDMVPSWGHGGPDAPFGLYRDGFQETVGFTDAAGLRMQNAATAPSDIRSVPRFGVVEPRGRAEPVAIGGVFGRGLWLTGDNRVRYDVPAQPVTPDDPYFVSLYLDARVPDDGAVRTILSAPDGTRVVAVGRSALALLNASGAEVLRATLPPALKLGQRRFRHVAVRTTGQGRTVDVAVDGVRLARGTVPSPGVLRFAAAGQLVAGRLATGATPGVRGWIDELRVMAEDVGPELLCNHARGTLVGLTAAAPADLRSLAALYPVAAHDEISARLRALGKPAFDRYACLHDYTRDHALAPDAVPGIVPVGKSLLFPEGPLHFGSPRPDSSRNAFCLTCHVPAHPKTLSVEALTPLATAMQEDRRRQPMQPPRLVHGWVPAGFVRPGAPAARVQDPGGLALDQWVFP